MVNGLFDASHQVYRAHRSGAPIEQLTYNAAIKLETAPIISPDGQWVAFYEDSTTYDENSIYSSQRIRQISLADQPEHVIEQGNTMNNIVWSPSGDTLAYIDNADSDVDSALVMINQADLTSERFMLNKSVDSIGASGTMLWSPMDDSIYFSSTSYNRAQVYRLDLKTHEQELIYQTNMNVNSLVFITLSWSPPIHKTWHPIPLLMSSLLILGGLLALVWKYGHSRQMVA